MLRRVWLPSLLLVLAVAGCSRCGKDADTAAPASTAGVARYLPRDAQAAVVINDLGALGEKLARFQKLKAASFAAQLQNFSTAEGYVSAVMRQIGVDLRSRQALETAGIAPELGAGAAFLGGNRAISVVGVKDAGKLEETFGNFARSRLGASDKKQASVDGGDLVTFSRPGSATPALGIFFVKAARFALLGAGPTAATLGTLATQPEERSLAKEPVMAASLQRLPAQRDFHVWLPGGAGFMLPPGTVQGVTLTGRIDDRAVTLNADAPWPDTQESLAALDAVAPAAGNLLGSLSADSFLVVQFRGDASHLNGVWPYLAGGYLTRAVQNSGLNVKTEVLDNLKPGAVMGVSLSPNVNLGAGMPVLDLRRTNPFRFVHLVALAEAEDATKLQSTLEQLPRIAENFGAKVEAAELGGQRVYLTSYRAGEGAHFALAPDGRLVVASPKARLESTLASLAKPSGAGVVAEDLKDAGKDAAFSAVLDLRRLSDAVKNLPSEAWGIGGFAIKATTVRWLEAVDDLRAVTLAVSRKDRALQAELSLRLSPTAATSSPSAAP
ncbi:hypothetical protein ACLEPN_29485 [Myxococcus sp. 1LA]